MPVYDSTQIYALYPMKINLLPCVRNVLMFLILLSSTVVFSQYESVDAKVRVYPATFSEPAQLADRINKDFDTDLHKARAVFTWVATNVGYDMKEYYSNSRIAYSYTSEADRLKKEEQFRNSLARKTIRTGKAVCEGYSTLFAKVCDLVGLEAVIITGTSRNHQSQIGKLPTASDHAWNAVKINGKWYLMDLAWGAGVVTNQKKFVNRFNDAYFATDPDKFALNHFPDDKRWLLTNKTAKEFADAPFFHPAYLNSDLVFNIQTGFVMFRNNQPLVFHVKNLQPGDRVSYITSKDNVLDPVQVSENKFAIRPSWKTSGYLTIFVNEKPVVSYRILKG